MITVHLYGLLAKKYKTKKVEVAEGNLLQVINGLCHRFGTDFKEDVRVGSWTAIKGRKNSKKDIGEGEVHDPIMEKTIHFLPAIIGASAVARIIVGIILIVVGVYGSIFTAGQSSFLVMQGVGLILGGVIELLTKPKNGVPTQQENEKATPVYNGAVNVTSQGGAIPWIYGRVQHASSVVISTDFSSDEAFA